METTHAMLLAQMLEELCARREMLDLPTLASAERVLRIVLLVWHHAAPESGNGKPHKMSGKCEGRVRAANLYHSRAKQ